MASDPWAEKLAKASNNRRVRLPAGVTVHDAEDRVRLSLSADAVCRNMQDDSAAFEGWALALLTWGGAQHVELDWVPPNNPTDVEKQHYQRFLYRVHKFQGIMAGECSLRRPERLAQDLEFQPHAGRFVLNVAGDAKTMSPTPGSEADLEARLAQSDQDEHKWLKRTLRLATVDRQVPVGVFRDAVAKPNRKLPGGKIDLVGLGEDGTFWVIELKLNDNRKMGAVSELFCYAMLMEDLQQGRLHCDATPGERMRIHPLQVRTAKRIRALLLMEGGGKGPAAHPLVHDNLLLYLSQRVGTIDFQVATLPCFPA